MFRPYLVWIIPVSAILTVLIWLAMQFRVVSAADATGHYTDASLFQATTDCTPVQFSEDYVPAVMTVTLSGAWYLNVKADPYWSSVEWDVPNKLIILRFNVPTGTIYIYESESPTAPLCQKYEFGKPQGIPEIRPTGIPFISVFSDTRRFRQYLPDGLSLIMWAEEAKDEGNTNASSPFWGMIALITRPGDVNVILKDGGVSVVRGNGRQEFCDRLNNYHNLRGHYPLKMVGMFLQDCGTVQTYVPLLGFTKH